MIRISYLGVRRALRMVAAAEGKRLSIRRLMAAGRPRAASSLLGSSGTSTCDIIAEAGLSKKQHLKSKLQFDRLSWLGDVGALV
jgi:hypothetical protein